MKCPSIIFVCFCIINFFANAIRYGDYRSIRDLPYMAQVLDGQRYICSAVILSDVWIISAAHCAGFTDSDTDTQIVTGAGVKAWGGKLTDIRKIFVSGDFDYLSLKGDISLIKLKTPIELNENQHPIQIARRFSVKVGDYVTVAGYGGHRQNLPAASLRSAQVPIIEHKYCKDYLAKFHNISLADSQFCTSTKEAELCLGDSGGPAVFNGKLIGITSFGCVNRRMPTTFTKLAYYYDWIMQITGINYDN